MDSETKKELDEVRAHYHENAEAHKKAMARMDKAIERMDKADARMDRIERVYDQAHEKAMARLDKMEEKFDRNLNGLRKILVGGMKMMVTMQAETRELKRTQKAILHSLGGGNGNGRKHS